MHKNTVYMLTIKYLVDTLGFEFKYWARFVRSSWNEDLTMIKTSQWSKFPFSQGRILETKFAWGTPSMSQTEI